MPLFVEAMAAYAMLGEISHQSTNMPYWHTWTLTSSTIIHILDPDRRSLLNTA